MAFAKLPSLQSDLFEASKTLPEGLRYQPELLLLREEAELARRFADLPFKNFQFHGFEGKRRTVSYGWRYAFDGSGLHRGGPIPDFLLPIRERVAAFAGLEPEALEQALIVEYAPGAGIGWHRDRPVFGEVAGVSLLAEAELRFRRPAPSGAEGHKGAKWDRIAPPAARRSAYLLSGPARSEWQHSILPMDELRYSITLRTLCAV